MKSSKEKKQKAQSVPGSQSQPQFEYKGATCPVCGREHYRGGNMGGSCEDCGYTVGFHGSGNSIRKD